MRIQQKQRNHLAPWDPQNAPRRPRPRRPPKSHIPESGLEDLDYTWRAMDGDTTTTPISHLFLIISISCAKLVITESLLLPSWISFSASHKRIKLPRSQESHPIFIFLFSPQDLQESDACTHHSYLLHPSVRPCLAMAIPKSKSSVV